MSHYPIPLISGLPLSSSIYSGPSVTPYSQQYPFQQANHALYGSGQNVSGDQRSASVSNVFPVTDSVRGIVVSTHGNGMNPTSSTTAENQPQHSKVASLQVPPALSSSGTLHAPQPLNQPAANSHGHSLTNPLPPRPQDHQTLVATRKSNSEESNIAVSRPELEDGEMSEGELYEPEKETESLKMGSVFSRPQQEQGISKETEERAYANIINSDETPISRSYNYSPFANHSQPSTSALGNQQPSTQNGHTNGHTNGLQPLEAQTPVNDKSSYISAQVGRALEDPPANRRSVDEAKEKAKKALQDLYRQGFNSQQIIDKGLNPHIIRSLSTEVDVPVIAPVTVQQQSKIQPQVTVPITASTIVSALPKAQESDESQTEAPSAIMNERTLTKPITNPTTTAKAIKPIPGKSIGTRSGESKPVDRKEYIARMLAAKAGKPAVSANIAASKIVPVAEPMKSSTSTSSTGLTKITPVAESVIMPVSHPATEKATDVTSQKQKEEIDAEAKRKAQTDLARQKIEELKLREKRQREIQLTAEVEPAGNTHKAMASEHESMLRNESVSVYRPPVPSRQTSYFSPASQKAPFSIPGLFMPSDPLSAASPSQSALYQGSIAPPEPSNRAITDSATTFASRGPEASVEQHTVTEPVTLPSVSSDITVLPSSMIHDAPNVIPRKRQKAADFIDSPSIRVKRPLGQQEDASMIIDISDDERDNDSQDNDVVMTGDEGQNSEINSLTQDLETAIVTRPIQFPTLTDSSSRKKLTAEDSVIQSSNQAVDSKGLKSKEMEIELMNRKIAELEQRINAKKANSRAQTPRRATISPAPEDQIALPKVNPKASVTAAGNTMPIDACGSSPAVEPSAEEHCLHRVQVAKTVVERSLAHGNTKASLEQRPEGDIHPSVKDQGSLLNGNRSQSQKDEISQHCESGLEEAQMLPTQDKQAHGPKPDSFHEVQTVPVQEEQAHEVEPDKVRERQALKGQMQLQEARAEFLTDRYGVNETHEQEHNRRTEIESGLPLLDATVERAKTRLESLRNQIMELELEIENGLKGRQALMEELAMLSRISHDQHATKESNSEGSIQAEQRVRIEELQGMMDSRSHSPPDRAQEQEQEATKASLQKPASSQQGLEATTLSSMNSNGHLTDEELEEDIMDISRSDVDEGEVSEHDEQSISNTTTQSDVIDDEDIYEPPPDIGMFQEKDMSPNTKETHEINQDIGVKGLDAADSAQFSGDMKEGIVAEVGASMQKLKDTDLQEEEQRTSHSPASASASDVDDYEPPEPQPYMEDITVLPQARNGSSETSSSPRELDIGTIPEFGVMAPGITQVRDGNSTTSLPPELNPSNVPEFGTTKQEPLRSIRSFTPYESPLKQFKSYRNHPEYLNEISHGFRSLTYSHSINSEVPICRYELGGVCNDKSCQSQHLKSAGLSDENILVDLGARPSGLSAEDFEAYTSGLQHLIRDIRNRKIRDFNTVAAEITAYRAKFLGDSSKVLPL